MLHLNLVFVDEFFDHGKYCFGIDVKYISQKIF